MTRKLVMVVHGIGEQQEGVTVGELVGGLVGDANCETTSDLVEVQEHYPGSDLRSISRFPAHTRTVKADKAEFDFVEVFWADLSRGMTGRFHSIYDFLLMILGLGYIATTSVNEMYPAHTYNKWVHIVMRSLCDYFVRLFHAALLPLNVLAALGIAIMLMIVPAQDFSSAEWGLWDHSVDLSVGLAGVLAFLWGWFIYRRRYGLLMREFGSGLRWLGGGLVVIAALHADSGKPWIKTSADCLGTDLDRSLKLKCDVADYFLLFPVALGVVFMFLLLLVCVMHALHSAQRDQMALRPGRSLFVQSCGLMAILFGVTSSILWFAYVQAVRSLKASPIISDDLIASLSSLVLPGMAPLFLASLGVAYGAILVVMKRSEWDGQLKKLRRKIDRAKAEGLHDKAEAYETEHKTLKRAVPRLIIGDQITNAVLISSILLTVVLVGFSAFANTFVEWAFNPNPTGKGFCANGCTTFAGWTFQDVMVALAKTTSVSALAVIGLFTLSPKPREVLELIVGTGKDVVGYFAKSRNPDKPAYEDSYVSTWAKARINGRFWHVLKRFWDNDRYDELIVVAHSQGGVVAVECIRGLPSYILKKTRLVTLGTPVGHIYDFYFPQTFNSSEPDVLGGFGPNGKGMLSWTNIYRADDYVGTWINGLHTVDSTGNTVEVVWPINKMINQKGHIGYWYDDEVRRHLFDYEFKELKPELALEPPSTL